MDKTASLSPLILSVVQDKGTEKPFSGEYDQFGGDGSYLCRRCGLALYRSSDKFHSGCGWPSFDEEVSGAIKRIPDEDGRRTEICCARCSAHLGHVFTGENFTNKNTRHCVNSLSLDFVADKTVTDTEEAIYAAGCFWGVQHYLDKLPGVLMTEVGYTGGERPSPTYEQVCSGATGHFEAVRVIYDPKKINFEALTKFFFEIHNFSQDNGQGPDIGSQYLSAIFYYNETQKNMSEAIIAELKEKGFDVSTKLLPAKPFWRGEKYHQQYYAKHQSLPYCHQHQKIFT
jgi:peptide methionine sulfoxide reductase msrA/msrB